MSRKLSSLVIGTAAIAIGCCFPVTYGQETETEPTTEERVARLERELAGLETRFEARTVEAPSRSDGPARGVTLSGRVDELERRLARLAADLVRVERQAAEALREAGQARRDATTAERIARQAATLRAR